MKKPLIFLAILLPVLALLYFSLTRDPRTLPSPLIGRPAPPFHLQGLDGKEVSLEKERGHPVVLSFWSTWCGPCLGEHEVIRGAMQTFEPQGVRFYAILYEDTTENAQAFIKQYGKAAPILLDPELRAAIDYGVGGVPETFFIDEGGTITYKQSGMLTPEILWAQVRPLIPHETQ